MYVAETDNPMDIRLMLFRLFRIPQENHKIQIILFNLRTHLLNASNVSSQIFADVKSGCLFYQTAGSSGCVKSMLGKYRAVGDTQVLKQRFFCIMRDQSDVH